MAILCACLGSRVIPLGRRLRIEGSFFKTRDTYTFTVVVRLEKLALAEYLVFD